MCLVYAHSPGTVWSIPSVVERVRCGEVRLMSAQDIALIPVTLPVGGCEADLVTGRTLAPLSVQDVEPLILRGFVAPEKVAGGRNWTGTQPLFSALVGEGQRLSSVVDHRLLECLLSLHPISRECPGFSSLLLRRTVVLGVWEGWGCVG